MDFDSCPECGETNYEEDVYSERYFDCDFQSKGNKRTARCGNPRRDRSDRRPDIPAEVNRYRLALLDAAHAAETIATDMDAEQADRRYIEQITHLANQMRELAGHSVDGHARAAQSTMGRFLATLRGKR